ncbi:DUF1638 domain-containing protein [Natroniella acetigena]|uniref:DUF1638 domain-containing protein n=1 Tax=Natroniella acetigena TaxID=52004 RepID=UPI00200B7090|nr:DUF1638 domain-containing protein [Natroniella acetigena]MCK8827435.1 DUF1638 domain-containing protein [Natroniella acetigena]
MKKKIIACKVLKDEIEAVAKEELDCQFLDYELHNTPENLTEQLQQAIDESGDYALLLIGYGKCSNGTIGINSREYNLVIPRVEDCIGVFLGSNLAYHQAFHEEPGTYYLTKGWIESGSDPYREYQEYVEKYGKEQGEWLFNECYKNYSKLALIDTGAYEIEEYRSYTQKAAKFCDFKYQELEGTLKLIDELVNSDGQWDEKFITVGSNTEITAEMF